MLLRAQGHKGSSFLEIYQNCNIFNDGAFEVFTEKSTKQENAIFVEQGQPMIFGTQKDKGIKLDGSTPVIVDLAEGVSPNDLWIHDEHDINKAQTLIRMFDNPTAVGHFPRPFGVFYETERACYEDVMTMQIEEVIATKGKGDLDKLLKGRETWTIS
jgi:2-oxoglutarate/2-oxoacid ferredoxin oxidoreductase subunit beta